ncbi:putative serine/threonine-protein kinase MRK1 like protein [Dictyocoela muelleri]|nr:putative serine/threonine-protein kinase MRK1 like protein [Dictyocoela muelleri]
MSLTRKKLADQIEKLKTEIGKIQIVTITVNEKKYKFTYKNIYQLGKGTFGVVMLIKCIDFYPEMKKEMLSINQDEVITQNKDEMINTNEKNIKEEKLPWNSSDDIILQKYALKIVYVDNRYKNRELEVLKYLNHKNVIKLFGHFSSEETEAGLFIHLILEFVPFSLAELITQDKIITNPRKNGEINYYDYKTIKQKYDIRKLYKGALLGLEYMHSLNICHRDIKPSNLMVTRSGELKISDLGSAKKIYKGSKNIAYVCSRPYRPPENLLGYDNYNLKIDIWSLGCSFAEVFTKKCIFFMFDKQNPMENILSVIKVSEDDMKIINQEMELKKPPNPIGLKNFIKSFQEDADDELIEVIEKSLIFSSRKRLSARNLLKLSYFKD